jgi:putative ABC transport system substrate-binding protein
VTRRRALLEAGAAAIALAPLRAKSQAGTRKVVIGLLGLGSRESLSVGHVPFEEALHALGYVEGRNATIERRYADGHADRLATLAGDLVGLRPDVLVAGSNPEISALRSRTATIPIVMAVPADPVGAGHVASLGRPGGNVTGLTASAGVAIYGKRLELLKEIVPGLRRVAVLLVPTDVSAELLADLERSAAVLGLTLAVTRLRTFDDYDAAFASVLEARAGALFVIGGSLVGLGRSRIVDFASRHRMPAIYALKEFAHAGLLLTYGFNLVENYRRAAVFVDKILRGAKPADLPVEQPVRFELVLNLKTAKAIGVRIPQSVLLRADEVIE